MALAATSKMKVRNIRVERNDTTNEWNLNGETWHDVVDSGFQKVLADPGLGDTEIWEIENKSGGWFHPVHIHLIDFKILSRNGKARLRLRTGPQGCGVRRRGREGPADHEIRSAPRKYMVHCHNLPHEDHDMMHQFSVGLKPGDVDVNDPISADPATGDDSP